MSRLKNKIALVTGASAGIGLATAQRFAAEGAHVYLAGRRKDELEKVAASIGKSATAVQADVSSLSDLDNLYRQIKTGHGGLDVLFANAGNYDFLPLELVTEEHFNKMFDLNVKGLLFTVQKALPLLRNGSSIVLNGSVASIKGMPGVSVYSATKAAVRSFARSWAAELKDRKIRTNVISPGPIKTPGTANFPEEMVAQIVGTIPLARMGEASEIAAAVTFLASDEASYITGVELYADGGLGQI
jgi:NAD(P)-dependent dehydrogenase (short-subunit alcohol dehydrogenase family)